MKVKLQANAELDLITQAEVREILVGWQAELSRGVRFRNFSSRTGQAADWLLGGDVPDNNSDPLGPKEGFVWSVSRLVVTGIVNGTDLYSVYRSVVQPASAVAVRLTNDKVWEPGVFVLQGGERLALSGVSTGTDPSIVVAGQVIELPVQLAHLLL